MDREIIGRARGNRAITCVVMVRQLKPLPDGKIRHPARSRRSTTVRSEKLDCDLRQREHLAEAQATVESVERVKIGYETMN